MRLGRLEFGIIKYGPAAKAARMRFKTLISHCSCKCIEIGSFSATWLSDECMPSDEPFKYGTVDIIPEEFRPEDMELVNEDEPK